MTSAYRAARDGREPALADDFLARLEPEHRGGMTYSHPGGIGRGRLAGGFLLAEAVLAAGRSLADAATVHSLHARFHRPGDLEAPVAIDVEETSDGRSFAARRVVITQSDRLVVSASLSFHRRQPGPATGRVDLGGVFDVDHASSDTPVATFAAFGAFFDVRAGSPATVSRRADGVGPPASTFHPFWIRHRRGIGADPVAHAAGLAFVTDVGVSGSVHPPGTPMKARFGSVSLDHALWFHQPARLDDWLLVSVEPQAVASGRGFAHGSVCDRGGVLVASFAQEVLLTPAVGPRGGGDATSADRTAPRPA